MKLIKFGPIGELSETDKQHLARMRMLNGPWLVTMHKGHIVKIAKVEEAMIEYENNDSADAKQQDEQGSEAEPSLPKVRKTRPQRAIEE